MLTIRLADPADVPTLVAMGAAFHADTAFGDFADYDPDSVRELLLHLVGAPDVGVLFVAERGRELVGAIAGHLTPAWFNRKAWVAAELALWVDPAHRGADAGSALIRAFEAWGAALGADAFSMSDLVVGGETPAGRLFQAHGYRVVERAHLKARSA
ncbi:MAG TPA: GNAT family N-acetyltransferase [Burkholderiaceae bacterium]|nr:GNAT family N-acetyltransferase [Burkholderiaceae bacterium]